MFFVISGYLIIGIILRDLALDQFSIRRFYERRARRILPALFTVMFSCIPFAFLWMLPSQYEEFSRSILAVLLFISNLFFWHESGYFAAEAAEKPLLHTWSLGVEEQFYLLFPLLLMLLWRWKKQRMLPMLLALALLSLGLSEYASRYYLNVNFFFLPTRAWELLIGAMAAFSPLHTKEKRCASPLALLGIALIIAAIFTFTETMRLPSALSFIPTLGTALVLRYATTGTLAAKLLSWPPLVGIGLISYSAYLWHQPLFAFARIRMLSTPDHTVMLALAAAALILAALSWKFIEQPFRYKHHPRYFHNKSAVLRGGIAAIMLVSMALAGYVTQGRLSYWMQHTSASHVRAFQLIEAARNKQIPHFYDNGDCVFRLDPNVDIEARAIRCHAKYGPGIAIIGDSHSINLFFVLKVKALRHPFMIGLSQAQCRPHSPLSFCHYERFADIVSRHPGLFRDIIYEQSGSYLIQKRPDNRGMADFAIDEAVPDYPPNIAFIDAVRSYLMRLAPYAHVTWFGSRIEPQIREHALIRSGCDYPFALRPNQAANFRHLDDAMAARLADSPIRFRSQIAMVKLDLSHDLMNCDTLYFADRNHYSEDGETRFGERITLDKILNGSQP